MPAIKSVISRTSCNSPPPPPPFSPSNTHNPHGGEKKAESGSVCVCMCMCGWVGLTKSKTKKTGCLIQFDTLNPYQ